jgi:hypothetical protein
MSKHNDVCSLAYSAKFRDDIRAVLDNFTHRSNILTDSFGLQLLQDVGYNDVVKIPKVFSEDDRVISHLFREVIHSGKEEIFHLSDEKVSGFMDALHKVAYLIGELNDNSTYLFKHSVLWRITTPRSSFQHAGC